MKKLKINFIFISILVIVSQAFTVFGTSNTDDQFDSDYILDQIRNNSEEPSEPTVLVPDIRLETPTTIDVSKAGRRDVEFKFKNSSGDPAKNLFFELAFDTSSPFIAYFSDSSNIKSYIGGRSSHVAKVSIDVFENAKNGTYPITFNYTYYDNSNNKNKFTGSSTVYVKIKDMTPENPIVTIEDFSIYPDSIVAGDDFTINAKLHNVNSIKISNVQVVIEGLASDGIYSKGSSSTFYKSSINGTTVEPITFELHASKNIPTGSNELKFKVVYNDGDGNTHESTYPYFVNVKGTSTSNSLKIDVKGPTKVLAPEEVFTVYAAVTNNGSEEINDIILNATPQNEKSISPMSANTINIEALGAGKSVQYEFKFMPTKDATTQTHIINVSATFDSNSKEVISTNYASATISNPDGDSDEKTSKSVPKIILSNYQSVPNIVYAGEPFELTMDFLNTSQSSEVKNIKVFLSVPSDSTETGNVFSPVNGSNTFYMYNIPAGGVVSKTLTLQPDYNAKAKNYDINVTMEYEDADNNALTQTEIVGIKVNQIIKLEYGSIMLPEFAQVYSPANVSFQFYNTGKVDLNNLKMKIEGDNVEGSDSEIFFGKFPIGSSDYYDGNFVFTAPGENEAYVLITYEDENGAVIEDKVDISCFVDEPMSFENEFMEDPNMMNDFPYEEEPSGLSPAIIIGIIVGLIVIVMVIIVIIRRKKSKREDDDLIE